MAQITHSADIYTDSNVTFQTNGEAVITPKGRNLGSLPTLYDKDGGFVSIANSFFFDLKAVKRLKDLNSYSRALLKYWSYLEKSNQHWDHFPPIKRLKPTYQFRSYLLTEVHEYRLSASTANTYINHVKQFYLWAMHEGYLRVKSEKEAPFNIEYINVASHGMLSHINPTFTVDSSDLRIRVAKNNVSSMNPLSRESLGLLAHYLPYLSEEFKLQCFLGVLCGLRIQEVSTMTIEALNTASPLAESRYRYQMLIGPSTGVYTKHRKERHIEISRELLDALKNYAICERRLKRLRKLNNKLKAISVGEIVLPKKKLDAFKRSKQLEPLFISEQGNPVDKKSIGARWTDIRKLIRQKNTSFDHKFHDLRCTYGTYRLHDLLEAGLPSAEALNLLMGWMGHNHEQTTWKYLRYLKRKEVFREKFALLDTLMHDALGGDNE